MTDTDPRLFPRVYRDTPPPTGEAMVLENRLRNRVLWTGIRWFDPCSFYGRIKICPEWPPDQFLYGPGPWHEVLDS